MAKIAERSLPFFKVLRCSGTFEWGTEQQEAFDALKEYIRKLPTLACPLLSAKPLYKREREIYIETRQKAIAPSPNIVRFQSSDQLKEILLRGGKDMLRCSHERKKASALFRSP
jgi:hypothetical protein